MARLFVRMFKPRDDNDIIAYSCSKLSMHVLNDRAIKIATDSRGYRKYICELRANGAASAAHEYIYIHTYIHAIAMPELGHPAW